MSEEYARSISKQVVAQLAEREGFQLAHGNALEALADVLNRFIREIGTYAKDYAELQGRTDVNILDLVRPPSTSLFLLSTLGTVINGEKAPSITVRTKSDNIAELSGAIFTGRCQCLGN